jgi:hypothetical protein
MGLQVDAAKNRPTFFSTFNDGCRIPPNTLQEQSTLKKLGVKKNTLIGPVALCKLEEVALLPLCKD